MRRVPRMALAAAVCVGAWACGQSAGDAQSAADTLSRRQRDSIISTMPIPGAGGVGRALDAQDAARARAAQLDSIAGN
jgi:ABC-type phosphate/phosphonate transport system substrate-binding protein